MSDFEIVSYRPEHLERIVEITVEGFQGVSIDYLIEERFGRVDPGWKERKAADIRDAVESEPEGVFVAVSQGEVAGYVTVVTSAAKSIGRIADLAVDGRFRRQGLGTALIERALEYIKGRGMRFAKIETLSVNEAGQGAYPRLGFVEVARQIHYVMPVKSDEGGNQG